MRITDENIRELKEVVRRETPRLLRLPRVLSVGVALKFRNGIPTETLCVRVTVKKKKSVESENTNTQRIEDVVRVEGYPVDVIEIEDNTETREPRVCDVPESEARTGTYDVLKGGIGIYAEKDGVKQPYGTLGMVVHEREHCQPLILTSRDILGALPISKIGLQKHSEDIFQGNPSSAVGMLLRSDFNYTKTNNGIIHTSNFLVAELAGDRGFSTEVEGIEFEQIFMEPKLGMNVWKSGAQSQITIGIITKVDSDDFRVSGLNGQPFAYDGDTGAIVFGEKDRKKRPIGMVTRLYEVETKEVRCVSLREAFIYNPWLDISLALEGLSTVVHRFWNEEKKSTVDSALNSPDLGGLEGTFKYQGPIYETTKELKPDAIPLYEWYNATIQDHFYSAEKNGEGKSGEGYIFNGQAGFVSKKKQGVQQKLHRIVNYQTGDHMMVFSGQIADARLSGYELDLSGTRKEVSNTHLSSSGNSRKEFHEIDNIYASHPHLPGTLPNPSRTLPRTSLDSAFSLPYRKYTNEQQAKIFATVTGGQATYLWPDWFVDVNRTPYAPADGKTTVLYAFRKGVTRDDLFKIQPVVERIMGLAPSPVAIATKFELVMIDLLLSFGIIEPLLNASKTKQLLVEIDIPKFSQVESISEKEDAETELLPVEKADKRKRKKRDDKRRFITYTITSDIMHRTYAGQTSGFGDYRALIDRRHLKRIKGREFIGTLMKGCVPKLEAYVQCPYKLWHDMYKSALFGREQLLIDSYGGAISEMTSEQTDSANPIRAVAMGNKEARYHHANQIIIFVPKFKEVMFKRGINFNKKGQRKGPVPYRNY